MMTRSVYAKGWQLGVYGGMDSPFLKSFCTVSSLTTFPQLYECPEAIRPGRNGKASLTQNRSLLSSSCLMLMCVCLACSSSCGSPPPRFPLVATSSVLSGHRQESHRTRTRNCTFSQCVNLGVSQSSLLFPANCLESQEGEGTRAFGLRRLLGVNNKSRTLRSGSRYGGRCTLPSPKRCTNTPAVLPSFPP
ncbi:hypothetical protein GQ53DRAFT_206937 [Thozetella sp. PMI_491]|nr:hypothetical protein GQ53DRAFT_206937 [Thozetella sp. PMI_491]